MQQRQRVALSRIMTNDHQKQVLVCMHGRAMKSFMCLLLREPLSNMEKYQHSNLCLYVVKYDGSGFSLVTHCDVEHLR
jgi:probable phosphoglycerate mutase